MEVYIMVIDIAILDYADAKVRLVACDVPDNYTNATIEGELELLGYNIDEVSYMTATNIELSDERGV
jgi:hypothetical protein